MNVALIRMAFYSTLDVSPNCDAATCRKAFRRAALRWHPDKSDDPGAEERFKAVERAWRVLSDPAAREAYDSRLRLGIDDGLEDDASASSEDEEVDELPRRAGRAGEDDMYRGGAGDGMGSAADVRRAFDSFDAWDWDAEPLDPEVVARQQQRERGFLTRVVCFMGFACLSLLALWWLVPSTVLFPAAMHVSNRQFGRYSLRDDFRTVTAAMVADHVASQPWYCRLVALVLRTHTPYLRLDANRTDLDPAPCASLRCPQPSVLLRTPRRVGQKTHAIFTFVQADPLDPPRGASDQLEWPPRAPRPAELNGHAALPATPRHRRLTLVNPSCSSQTAARPRRRPSAFGSTARVPSTGNPGLKIWPHTPTAAASGPFGSSRCPTVNAERRWGWGRSRPPSLPR